MSDTLAERTTTESVWDAPTLQWTRVTTGPTWVQLKEQRQDEQARRQEEADRYRKVFAVRMKEATGKILRLMGNADNSAMAEALILLVPCVWEDLSAPRVSVSPSRGVRLWWRLGPRELELEALPKGGVQALRAEEAGPLRESFFPAGSTEEARVLYRWLKEGGAEREGAWALLKSLARKMLMAGHESLAQRTADLAARLVKEGEAGAVLEVVKLLAAEGGSEGAERGVDVLSLTGPLALRAAKAFFVEEEGRLSCPPTTKHEDADDAWYILLRGLAKAHPDKSEAASFIRGFTGSGSRSVRVAATEALGDLQTEDAAAELERLLEGERDPLVLQTIKDALGDMRA